MLSALLRVLLCVLVPLVALAAPPQEAVDRGNLSLAWDAWEGGRCEEALTYLSDIPTGSPVAAEALRLRTDCLTGLKRYGEAAHLLEAGSRAPVPEQQAMLLDVYSDWATELTGQERYRQVGSLAKRGLAFLPGNSELEATGVAAGFRNSLARAVSSGRTAGRWKSGVEFAVRPLRSRPAGKGWVRAYPWQGETSWIPDSTLEDWMPALSVQLKEKHRALWVRTPAEALRRAARIEARRRGLAVRSVSGGLMLSLGEERVHWDVGEWQFRAATEGLGLRAAALASVGQMTGELHARAEMVRWILRHEGRLDVRREGQVLRIREPSTGRSYVLDPSVWAPAYPLDSGDWAGFWSDLVAELGRRSQPYRCFCGRPLTLRPTLMDDAEAREDGALVFERGKGYSLVLLALCPLHQEYVTEDLLKQWGVSLQEAWARADADAVERPWDLTFERGEASGDPYLVLQGDGVSSLARRPELLLGALEAVDGSGIRRTSVSVWAPTSSSLLVFGRRVASGEAREAMERVLLEERRRVGAVERLGYRVSIRLPNAGIGSFHVQSRD